MTTPLLYCDKPSVNRLTALLCRAGLRDVVVCPGSRNGVLAHNFYVCPALRCHPVTDERSAAFFALGLSLATRRPAAICVTSGSALLGTLPAVAEAAFRHVPLLVVSADRPARWVGQLDGQTLPQPGALMPYAPCFNLPEDGTPGADGWTDRLLNEALLALRRGGGGPVHVNVPLDEPLFSFGTPQLPDVRLVSEIRPEVPSPLPDALLSHIKAARLPVLLLGERDEGPSPAAMELDNGNRLLVLPELVANQPGSFRTAVLEALPGCGGLRPDLVIHAGGTFVNKRMKQLLRTLPGCSVVRIEESDALPDTFGRLTTVVRSPLEPVLRQLAEALPPHEGVRREKERLAAAAARLSAYRPAAFADVGIVQRLARRLPPRGYSLHLGNSSVVRNACWFFDGGDVPIHCNRGLNGIEGSLSTAVGYASADSRPALVLIGDLSFFYDQNALWNGALPPNLRIVLFNNGGGQIFYRLPGLPASPALTPLVAAAHHTSAEGLARSYGLSYHAVRDYDSLERAIGSLLAPAGSRPVLVEAFTRTADNESERLRLLHTVAGPSPTDIIHP